MGGNADTVISAARDGWPAPHSLARQIERLLPAAVSRWHVADNLIGLLGTASLADQARLGLPRNDRRPKRPKAAHLVGLR